MGENITLTEPAARIALFIGKSKYLLLLFKMRTNSINIFHKYINRITILLSACCKTYCFALPKRRFCTVKAAVLQRKTAAFGIQNNRFCNALITRWLCNSCACEKYLQIYSLISAY